MIYPDINLKSTVPLYLQIKRYYQRIAALGLIEADDKLPSVRELASELGINPNTVHKAYSELELENVIYAVPGKGYYLRNRPDDEPSFEEEEILRHFKQALQVAWTGGFSEKELHDLLDESIRESKKQRRSVQQD
ncbi:MAG: GntR family transcriptional regulator [Clostridiaceae bacterium]|jgi:GntR family transcriptional regulator|nr:GntR family transcriptional regulator [Clostridiaceae bacterium]